MIIDGKRIEIIKANENYAEKFYEYLQELKDDPENYTVIRYQEVKLEDVNKIKWEDNPMFLALEGNRIVGSLQIIRGKYFGIARQNHVGELAYSVSKEFRGKGLIYALFSHALENIKLKIITAWVDERNIRSQKLLEKLNFTKLGKINEFMYSLREGIYVNLLFYVGNADNILRRAKEELERRGIKYSDS
ncbi:GNAT family N-acetyltransferase [Saccharolobus caldissimus]|uniref:GNAT family N-acetyltransferase n=1 Tax=Saccharolobus caldissimus TaxID=1702097 RepID=A0AAQ4CR17_9CREN|nr:GNAT family protein [Saccharolobus caldissimus]BDB98248.1 GNAT family N-acetyltransferase [Saccharolobus caldissimus]